MKNLTIKTNFAAQRTTPIAIPKPLQKPEITIYTKNNDLKVICTDDSSPSFLLLEGNKFLVAAPFETTLTDKATLILGEPKYQLKIDSKNGHINIDNFKGTGLDITTANGKISIHDTIAKSVSANARNASIKMSNTIAENIGLTNQNGKIKVTDVKGLTGTIAANNGMIDINDSVFANSLSLNTKNDNIIGQNIKSQKISGTSSNGNITLKKLASDDIELKTTHGNISLYLEGEEDEYQSYLTSNNGYTDNPTSKTTMLPKTLGQKKLRATANNGNISIRYQR